jgi:hypothetical protein
VTGTREDEVTVMRIGHREDVRQCVTEHEAGDGEREHRRPSELSCGCRVAHGLSRSGRIADRTDCTLDL